MITELEQLVGKIDHMSLEGLREEWRQHYGAPPLIRSVPILRQLLAWRIQADALGGLDLASCKALARSGPVEVEGRQLGIGARLTRNWKGREVTVVVQEEGFSWNGQQFPSLSAAATAIAGSRWNGPRFFGLRDS